MASEALDSLQQALNRILKQDDHLNAHPVKLEIVSIHDQAVVLQLLLKDFPEKETIREVAITAREVIGYLFSEENLSDPTVELANQLREIAKKLQSIARSVVDYIKSNGLVNNVRRRMSSLSSLSSSSSRRPAPTGKNVVVGFDEDLKVIKDRLLEGSPSLQILPIVGTRGIGKTTLAKTLYNDEFIKEHFGTRGWATVSQDYSVGSIVSNLLASMKGISEERDHVRSKIPKEDELREYLMDRRYFIVMDDMWSKKAWDDVRNLFPNTYKRSCIILTTRLQDVAAYANPSNPFHVVRPLSAQDSWRLVKSRVFGDERGPPKMQRAGKEIAKRCGGLPLSLVVVAGLLSKNDQTYLVWKQIAESDGQLETIISVSYMHLPHHVKSCFLYMGGFPEDYAIHVSELIKLWIAEGFIRCTNESKTLEEEAEDCLEDLVKRGLVLVTSKKLIGKTKTCSLHDAVRDFCIRQGQQENLLLAIVDYLPSPILRGHFLPLVLKNHKRISVTWYDLDLKDSMHSSRTHSIICIPQKGYRPKGYVVNFSLLKVLHVLRRNDYWEWEPSQVFDLIHLTYLASNIPSTIVPPAISNLQSLVIYRSEVHLPVEIWRLRQLRHLIAFSFHPLPLLEGEAFPLENFQTLSLATDFICGETMVEMIPNIKKLGICYSEEKFDEEYHLDNLIHLLRLEKLKLISHSSFWPHAKPIFPKSLKKLELSGWRLPWSDMTIVGSLPNLQVLKLKNYACDGEHWETIEGEFVNLRHLLIDGSNLQHWTARSSHFTRLQCLMLHRCQFLEDIPIGLGDIPTLEMIEIDDFYLLHSAQRMQQEQLDYGNDALQVRVKNNGDFLSNYDRFFIPIRSRLNKWKAKHHLNQHSAR